MKHIKPYKIFESNSPNFPTTREEVIQVCEKCEIENYTINDDLSIDVNGDVNLAYRRLEYFPLKFNYVSGYFGCPGNQLETLEGCPQRVSGDFDCPGNGLKSLEGCPQTVGGNFDCSTNYLQTLEGGPSIVGGYFSCSFNKLETLKGCPQTINHDFYCFENKLETLEGSPQTVDGDFKCLGNELKSLKGCPKTVGGNFDYRFNKLKDLEYLSEVNGNIHLNSNPVYHLLYTFIETADSFLIEDFVDYEIVRNRDTVMLDRLETFIRDNDLEMPDLEEIKKHYKIIE
jgi:hypothetical protein